MSNTIEIPLSKTKIFLITLGSFLFVALSIWIMTISGDAEQVSIRFLRNPIVLKAVGVLGILFFSATGIFGMKRMMDNEPGLIIDDRGITDSSSGVSVGLIEWKDIIEVTSTDVMSNKFLLIHVEDTEKYINMAGNAIKARLLKSNLKMYGTPISISASALKTNFKDLESLLQSELQKHRNIPS